MTTVIPTVSGKNGNIFGEIFYFVLLRLMNDSLTDGL